MNGFKRAHSVGDALSHSSIAQSLKIGDSGGGNWRIFSFSDGLKESFHSVLLAAARTRREGNESSRRRATTGPTHERE